MEVAESSRKRDLEQRLISFAVRTMKVVNALPKSMVGRHVAQQLFRSATSPAPNYSEAQSAESLNDFVHKMKVGLKELRETHVWLRIIEESQLIRPSRMVGIIRECDELISIFVSIINKSARKEE